MASSTRVTKRSARGRRGRSGSVRRLLTVAAFLPLAGRIPVYARLVWALLADARMPVSRKALLAGAVGYVLLGRDVVPDDVPVVGSLDDVMVVALAMDLFLDGVDEGLLGEKLDELGIARIAYDEDMARIRRYVPGPIRRAVRRLPRAIDVAAQAFQSAGLGPRLRAWLDREGSPA